MSDFSLALWWAFLYGVIIPFSEFVHNRGSIHDVSSKRYASSRPGVTVGNAVTDINPAHMIDINLTSQAVHLTAFVASTSVATKNAATER